MYDFIYVLEIIELKCLKMFSHAGICGLARMCAYPHGYGAWRGPVQAPVSAITSALSADPVTLNYGVNEVPLSRTSTLTSST